MPHAKPTMYDVVVFMSFSFEAMSLLSCFFASV
jgi:hypothetical protein